MRLKRRVDLLTDSMETLRRNEQVTHSLLWDLKGRFLPIEDALAKRCAKCKQKLPQGSKHGG